MKEIARGIFIKTAYKGVTVGAIRTPEGMVMIDVPLVNKDIQSWQTTCARSGTGSSRLLVLLDDHPDRTAGAINNRFPIITHVNTAVALASRPPITKMQGMETGAIWETIPEICTVEWPRPEITFTNSITINWGEKPIVIEHHPGPTAGSSWVILPNQKIVFVGDTVTPGQPPFLSSAEIKPWVLSLDILKSSKFEDFVIISGRAALIANEDIRQLQRFLKKALRTLDKLYNQKAEIIKVQESGASFIDEFKPNNNSEKDLFRARLSYGFSKYYINNYSLKK
jgi:glyoxylase-like metal-dependent hydrolase (beta-lactamase superfamily II)